MAAVRPLEAHRHQLKIAVVGEVDHGKSTLVGRLLHDMNALPHGRIEAVQEMCRRRAMPFEWAFVTDALQAERDQGITIDVSYIRFATRERDYVLIDAPGHRQFLKNMISGSAGCDCALVVIAADEGVRQQSRRHAFLLHLLGVRQIAVAVTKMDLIGYDAHRFAEVEFEFRRCLDEVGVKADAVIPVSGREGDNLSQGSAAMRWYRGPTVIEALGAFAPQVEPVHRPLRIPVQDVYKFDARRIIAGRVESGRVKVGDTVLFSPSNLHAKVKSLEAWAAETPIYSAEAGEAVALTLDDQTFVERGEVISHLQNAPIETNVFRARLFWFGAKPLTQGSRYELRLGTAQSSAEIEKIERVVDTVQLAPTDLDSVPKDGVADVVIRTKSLLALDPADQNARTGRFVILDGTDIAGGGLVKMEGYPDQRSVITRKSTNLTMVEHRVTSQMRMARNAHAGAVIWFTGLSGAGKSTLAVALEWQLFNKGYQVYVLDGDNLRYGLNSNLGFSPEDRAENIRRVGEIAALFAKAGFIVITAFISPYVSDRERARAAVPSGMFREIYIKAGLAACEARDPKGLYRKARAGEISDFTGISAPYEPPEKCDLTIDTEVLDVAAALDALTQYVETQIPRI